MTFAVDGKTSDTTFQYKDFFIPKIHYPPGRHNRFTLYLDKHLKDLIARMLDCGYFEDVPNPPPEKKPEVLPEKPPKTEIHQTTKLVELVRAQGIYVLRFDI